MSAKLPPTQPRASFDAMRAVALKEWFIQHPHMTPPSFLVLAVRGYYADTIAPKGNNVGDYDDALFIMHGTSMSSWNANVDPSRYGWNANAGKYMARLAPGVWTFVRLKHHANRPTGYMAFGQGDNPVTVERIMQDGSVHLTEKGCFGINLHKGGDVGTSSEGCLTVPPKQWSRFDSELAATIRQSNNKFTLILTPAINA